MSMLSSNPSPTAVSHSGAPMSGRLLLWAVTSALAGFLFQQGCQDRSVAQHYLNGLFQRGGASLPGPRA